MDRSPVCQPGSPPLSETLSLSEVAALVVCTRGLNSGSFLADSVERQKGNGFERACNDAVYSAVHPSQHLVYQGTPSLHPTRNQSKYLLFLSKPRQSTAYHCSMSRAEYELFKELAQIFSERQDKNQILEFEILPPALALDSGPLVQDGCSVGVTKKALVQAFAVARRIFFRELVSMSASDMLLAASREHHEKTVSLDGPEEIKYPVSVVSEIILLFDCEHLTACNWRKRWFTSLVLNIDPVSPGSAERDRVVGLLEAELNFLTTLLCSPLPRHTKSPTLWQHRRWILANLIRARKLVMAQPAASETVFTFDIEGAQELLKSELAVVLRSGELHPRNYYAFSYMRQLHSDLADAVEGPRKGLAPFARSTLSLTLDWCLAHPRDISGWMFVLWLLEAIPDQEVRAGSITTVLGFALRVGWEGESLWTFIDLAARSLDLVETVEDTMRREETGFVGFTAQNRFVNGVRLPEQPWKTWLARARVYWGTGDKKPVEVV